MNYKHYHARNPSFSVIDRNASNGISNIQSARASNVFEMFVIDFHIFKALNVLTLALTLSIFKTEVLKKSYIVSHQTLTQFNPKL